MDTDACVRGPDNSRVYLDKCRRKSLQDLVQRAWSFQVVVNVCHRNGLRQLEPPLPVDTGNLFKRLTANEQQVIARHIAGSFGSAAAKHQWDEDIPEECPLCGARQTKEHKLLWCPALATVRKPHQEFLDYALANWPHWCHGPFAVSPPNTEVNRLIFHTRALLPPLQLPGVLDLPGPRGFLRMFTDGSCKHPTLPLASRASFSVVVDTSTCDAEIPGLLAEWRAHGNLPPCFRVHSVGLVPGEQNIHRAELCAILQAVRIADGHGCPAEIWTDSQVALNEWDRVYQGLPPLWPDLSEEFRGLSLNTVRVRKIAAHRDLTKLWGMEQWYAAGNDVADTAAKDSLRLDFELVQTSSDETAVWQTAQRDALWLFWRVLLALSQEEIRLLRAHYKDQATTDPLAILAPDAVAVDTVATASLLQWKLLQAGPWCSMDVPPVRREVLLACSWPPWFTYAVWSWARRLEWTESEGDGRAKIGATNVELLVCFVLETGVIPPPAYKRPEWRIRPRGGFLSPCAFATSSRTLWLLCVRWSGFAASPSGHGNGGNALLCAVWVVRKHARALVFDLSSRSWMSWVKCSRVVRFPCCNTRRAM